MSLYGGRLFRPVTTDGASDTSSDTIFKYDQRGDLLMGSYSGGRVEWGSLIGTVDERGHIDMRYHHRTITGQLMTGICHSEPEFLKSGKIRLYENWQWTSPDKNGNKSRGTSVLEEI